VGFSLSVLRGEDLTDFDLPSYRLLKVDSSSLLYRSQP
jgi:hypothetical protein